MKNNLLYLLILLTGGTAMAQEISKKSEPSLLEMTEAIATGKYPGIHSILISKPGQPLYEHYFNGYTADSLHDTRSSFKSITSLLVGIAIDEGFIKNVNQKVADFFPENESFKTDPYKKEMTLKNLLEMKSGFDCEEFNETKDCEENMSQSKDWVQFSLDLPMKDLPGEKWAYTSVDPMLFSGIIEKSTGLSVMEFAKKYLFAPLHITQYRWTTDPAGHGMTAGSFYMLPKDALKLGQLVQSNGKWHGKRIISQSWLRESTACTIPISDFSFSRRNTIGIPQPTYYGYYWYREVIKTPELEEPLLFASGNGGQYIFIVQDLDLVVVFNQGNYNSFKAKQAFEIMARYILPIYKKKP